VGQLYLQEWSSGEAEDATKMVSTSYGLGSDSKPHAQDLAESPKRVPHSRTVQVQRRIVTPLT
jgi:hypothetical protein